MVIYTSFLTEIGLRWLASVCPAATGWALFFVQLRMNLPAWSGLSVVNTRKHADQVKDASSRTLFGAAIMRYFCGNFAVGISHRMPLSRCHPPEKVVVYDQ